VKHLPLEELEKGMPTILESPKDSGLIELIVCRPRSELREILCEARLDLTEGLVGDNWKTRGSRNTPDGSSDTRMQITIMNSRVITLIAQSKKDWPLAGDQLFIDLDLSKSNLPPGTRLALGSAVLEVTGYPHTGCKKFSARFGLDATKFINSPQGRELQLRGINARVIKAGTIRVGDAVKKQRAST
jgi:hypothetical protein